jgi:hypothetical protein
MTYCCDWFAKANQKFALVVSQRILASMADQSFQGISINRALGQSLGYENSELWRGVLEQCVEHQSICFGDWPGF